jgi:predicted phosphohydrolase
MAIFAIADLHLDTLSNEKSMEVFGNRWRNYVEKIEKNWNRVVGQNDTVIVAGDISWGLNLESAIPDLKWIDSLPGRKILMKGNHDFWWSTASKMNKAMQEHQLQTIEFLSNNAFEVENCIVAGSRGWFTDRSMQNAAQDVDYAKIMNREVIRLKMSLDVADALRAKSDKEILAFLHFPPIWGDFRCEEILSLLRDYGIRRCYFGHIHGTYHVPSVFLEEEIEFHMISADYLDFLPQIIL